uniref:Uncharacterized protein n=1 Tax=Zea mays TaxID=4577 RepID=A0A804LQ55_MAIZE
GAAPAVHGDPYLRELLRRQVPRRRDLLPDVRQEALERGAPAAHAGLEVGDELLREVDAEVLDPVHGEDGVGAARAMLAAELDVPVVEPGHGRVAWDGDGRAVGEGRR